MSERFPLVSYFGVFDEEDYENHSRLTNLIDIQNIGTDLVTPSRPAPPGGATALGETADAFASLQRLERAAQDVACHGVLLSVGRDGGGGCGTVSEALALGSAAQQKAMVVAVDTADGNEAFNAALAVGLQCGQCLAPAPTQPSSLLAIEEELGPDAVFAGTVSE